MKYFVIDVETANADLASICQVGLVTVETGSIIDEWSTLINPEDYFDGINIGIHGIHESDVRGAPTFQDIYSEFSSKTRGSIIASHTSFDRAAVARAAQKYRLSDAELTWIDSARMVRRAWPDRYAKRGYGLANVASDLGIEFKHHDALEDARATARIVIRACEETGLDIEAWLERVERPISDDGGSYSGAVNLEPNSDGSMFGEVIVFTGSLQLPRREAKSLAAEIGCQTANNVTKKTTLLVVGDQDISRLAGHAKSSKHRKAEDLIGKGQPIRILQESDFIEIVSNH